ncbi:MAG: FAD-dependent protein [Candidatus Omnitrophota bacterium]|nr:NAD(P)/FAD-dependent oxidoreductase [Candidatus Omnitrophota bacterium]MBU1894255.1 NAD(P)/FAD-dependent oxidoreductase [Candidatus Omnitrophota bacterium]
MGHKKISLKLPTDYTGEQLRKKIEKKLKIKEFSCQVEKKSLDARRKSDIHWEVLVSVSSKQLKGDLSSATTLLNIPYKKRKDKVVVVGSGPAGFFCAFVLQKAGFNTTLIERGEDVKKRGEAIRVFEKTGVFNSLSNYAFGEGGAGTFSDGKLTSRSKHILQEGKFIVSAYISAGAPEEIAYMAHPHLGSDNLCKIVTNLREEFLNIGGKVLFETLTQDLKIEDQTVSIVITTSGDIKTDEVIFAPGHSAYETHRMLIKRGVKFRSKSFALGCRVEHPQELINIAQWGQKSLPGVKSAEYRLASRGNGILPVYTFCMCPGGSIVPSSAYKNANIVNGMSLYARDGKFANSACVAGVNLDRLKGRPISPLEALNWLENLEGAFYEYSDGFKAPSCSIKDFIAREVTSNIVESSYPLGLKRAALWDLLPSEVSNAIREGLKDFSRKIKGFETGAIIGLDSKSSSPVQVIREENYLSSGFKNLYMAGAGSGYSGGIMSSAADGIKVAMAIIAKL